VRSVREIRHHFKVKETTPIDVTVRCSPEVTANFDQLRHQLLPSSRSDIRLLAAVGELKYGPDVTKPPLAASHVDPDFTVYVSLAGLIDVAAEVKRIEKQLADKRKYLEGLQKKLANEDFVKNAPPEVVQQLRDQIAETERQIQALVDNLRDLRPE
jgi:valyl-tRNA synthetase